MEKRNRLLLAFIITVAAVLRLVNLGGNPPHLTPDEAALGYNAYSILKTGRDEYGQAFPIIFKSFGDFKPGLYVYTALPFVATFGLTEFAVRLPSALAGVVAVWLLYLLIKNLKHADLAKRNVLQLEFVAPALLAISPWHIHFSRGAWEANLSLTLALAGIYFFLKSLKVNRNLIYSAFFFALTLLTYQGAKLSTAIVIFVLAVTFWDRLKHLLQNKFALTSSIIVFLVVAAPVILSFFHGQTGRITVFSVFSHSRNDQDLLDILNQGKERMGDASYYLYHSEVLNYLRGIMGRWFNHFSGRFLFFDGDYQNPRHSLPNHGMLLLFDLVFVPLGIVALLRKKTRFTRFALLWLVLAPLPAVLTRDQVHAVRALNMVIPLTLVSALGLSALCSIISKVGAGFMRTTAYLVVFAGLMVSFIYFCDAYFIHQPNHNAKYWEYGYKQVVETITPLQGEYEKIKIQQSFAQPYIYFLFYQNYDPASYQRQAKLVDSEYKDDVGYIEKIDNIYFTHINWGVDRGDHGTIVVADTLAVPVGDSDSAAEFNLIKEIDYPNGDVAFRVIGVK